MASGGMDAPVIWGDRLFRDTDGKKCTVSLLNYAETIGS